MTEKPTPKELEKSDYGRKPERQPPYDLLGYIISHARSSIAVHDRDLKYLYVSKRYLEEYKVEEAKLIGKHHYEVFPDLPQKWRDVHQKALAGEVLTGEEDPFYREDGSIDWTRWECRPWYEPDGSIGGIVIYTEIINDRMQIENALRISEERLDLAIKGAGLGLWDWNIQTGETVFNERWAEIVGYTLAELSPVSINTWLDLCHPEDLEKSTIKIEEHFSGKAEDYFSEVRMKHKEGHWVWVLDRGKVFEWDSEGKPLRAAGIHIDITQRKLAEEMLKINERRLQLALEGAELGMWDWKMQTDEVYFNPRYLSMLGYGPTELPHTLQTWENLLHSEDKDSAWRQVLASAESGAGKWNIEFRMRHKEGHYIWVSGSGKVVEFSPDGLPLRATGIHQDITGMKIAEAELRDRETRFREIFNNMSSAVAIYDAVEEGNDFVFRDLNRAGLRSSRVELCEVVGKKVTDSFPGVKKMGLFEVLKRVHKTGISEYLPSSFYLDKRLTLWVENYVCKLPSGQIMVVYDDITERKKSEEKLIRAKEEWEKTFNAIPDVVTIQDRNMQIVRANQAASDLFVMDADELVGQKCYKIFHGFNDPCPECPGTLVFENLNSHIGIIEHQKLNKIFQISSSPLLNDNKEVQYLVHVARDITEQKMMEDELLKAHKLEAVGVLAGGIAHDFNNILAAILGNISLALEITDSQAEVYELLAESEKASMRAQKLTQQLLTFAKGGDPVKKTATINEVVKDSADFVLRGSNVRCDYTFGEGLSPVEIDSGQISQVIQNIVLNAIQAMPKGGVIEIDCSNYNCLSGDIIPLKTGGYIKISIKDDGIGIPKDLLDNIFDPYFTTKQKGSGLGLAISHSIISKHGGFIDIDSEPGQGTTFTIYLPASQGRIVPEIKESLVPPETVSGRIMIMDDEEMVRTLVHAILSRRGYEVISTEDGKQAIQLYQEALASGSPIDLIIMDLTIPGGMGGKEAVKEIHKINPKARVIVSSGYSNDPVMAGFREYGFKAALAKPFKMQELLKVVAKETTS